MISLYTIPKMEVLVLKKSNKLTVFITVVSAVAAVAAAVVAVVLFLEKKKKDEEELEHYLDCSIQ
jgi:flagellar basal body-associated protein FliL